MNDAPQPADRLKEDAGKSGRRVVMTLGGGGQLFAARKIAAALDPLFDVRFVTTRDSRTGVDEAYRDRVFYNPSLQVMARRSTARVVYLTLVCIVRSLRLVHGFRPHAIVGVQGASALPLLVAGTIYRSKRIYIETFTRPRTLSRTARLLLRYRLVDRIYVQWPTLVGDDERIVYRGTVL